MNGTPARTSLEEVLDGRLCRALHRAEDVATVARADFAQLAGWFVSAQEAMSEWSVFVTGARMVVRPATRRVFALARDVIGHADSPESACAAHEPFAMRNVRIFFGWLSGGIREVRKPLTVDETRSRLNPLPRSVREKDTLSAVVVSRGKKAGLPISCEESQEGG